MIKIPVFLFVAQWALLAALGLLVVIMYRQLGRLLAGGGEAAALGPEVGSQAAALTYVRPGDQRARQLTPGDGQPLLVAFADPTCPSCEQLVAALTELSAAGQLSDLRTLVLISDPPSYLQISDVFSATDLEVGLPGGTGSTPTGFRRRRCSLPSTARASCGPPGLSCGPLTSWPTPGPACCRCRRSPPSR